MLTSQSLVVMSQLIQALALCLHLHWVSPLTTLHIPEKNLMTDIPCQSFGSVLHWKCKSNMGLFMLYNCPSPLPHQDSWNIPPLSSKISLCVIFILQIKDFTIDKWQ
ncbi:hypothetical protein ACHAXS_000369 [Conticribra weissflogii]